MQEQHLAKFNLCSNALTHFKTSHTTPCQSWLTSPLLCAPGITSRSFPLTNVMLVQLAYNCKLYQNKPHKTYPQKRGIFLSLFLPPTHPPQGHELRRHQLFANRVIPLLFKLLINMHIMTVKMKMLKLSWSYFSFTLYKGRYWNNLH